jgi:ribonuclease P protein component
MADSRGALGRRMQRRDFLTSTREGARRTTQYFIVFVRDRRDGGRSRLGVTVTRKVGSAVRRNRIKRLAREWFRSRSRLGEFGSCDLVLIAKREFPESLRLADVARDLDPVLLPSRPRAPLAS